MHLLETYALNCGLKIDRPYVYEHYTSIPYEKFISFNKKTYPYFTEVINLIKNELDQRGIQILQLHASAESAEVPITIFDGLSFGQWAYLIKHSLLHFGEEDFLFDLAGYYDIPRVILFSSTYPETFKPYWGSKDKERVLFNIGPNKRPTFSMDPNQNFSRLIKPEEIAQNIMDLLGVKWTPPYQTVYAGAKYRPHHDVIEVVPDSDHPIDVKGRVSALVVRMDYKFDERFLIGVLEKTKASIVTDRPINMGILQALRNNILEVLYIVDGNSDVQFARDLAKLNLPYGLVTKNSDVATKERFFEVTLVQTFPSVKLSDFKEFKDGLYGLEYKSAKRVLHGQQEYKGQHQWESSIASAANTFSPCPLDAPESFLRELEFFFVIKPNPQTA